MPNPFLAYGLAAVAAYLLLKKEEEEGSASPAPSTEPKPEPQPQPGGTDPEPEPQPETDPNALPPIPSMSNNIVVFSENQEHYKIGFGYRYRVMECWMAQNWCAGKIIGKYDVDEAESWSEDPSDFLGDGLTAELIFAVAAEVGAGLAIAALGLGGLGLGLVLGGVISYFVGEDYILPPYHKQAMESTAAGALVEFMKTMEVSVGTIGNKVPISELKDTPATREFTEYLVERIAYFQSQQMDKEEICNDEAIKSVCLGTSP